jgi:hypothetical protein
MVTKLLFCRGFFQSIQNGGISHISKKKHQLIAVILVKLCVRRRISKAKIRANSPKIHGYTERGINRAGLV